ncbi:MAG TPA: LON peptidase substrate-binding domain-containing protein, partial [Candidatus Eremiobacteraceae bacterium]|nr:LON peptidase substrate-binding domain-containing protein [Candidatus Eremiobacteraceae bacterium]
MASEFNAHEAGSIPSELAILPLQDSVLFPNTVMPLAVTKPYGIKLVEDALKASAPIGVVALKNRDASPPAPDDVYTVGTVAIIQKMIKIPDGTLRCIISGTVPFTATEFTRAEPYLVAKVEPLEEQTTESDELTALSRNLASQYTRLLAFLPSAPKELELEVNNITDPNLLSYFIASTMRLDNAEK